MRLAFLFSFILFALYTLAARIYIARSCDQYTPILKPAIDSALTRARLARDQLNRYPARTPGVDRLAKLLLDSSDKRAIHQSIVRFSALGNLLFDYTTPLWDESLPGAVTDIIFYCNWDRFVYNPKKDWYFDEVGKQKMTTDDWRIYVEEAESEGKMAITAQVTDTRTNQVYSASKMNIMTYLLDTFLRRHRLGLTSIFDFSSATDVDRFIARMQRYGDHEPWIDELSVLLDSIILHELSHSWAAGYALDYGDGHTAYGWDNALRLQRPDNADNLNMFALAATLSKLGYTVENDGIFHS